jgi:hypothetical protein
MPAYIPPEICGLLSDNSAPSVISMLYAALTLFKSA